MSLEDGTSRPNAGQLNITSEREGERLVLSLQGELDIATCTALERQLQNAASAPCIVVDLGGLAFMDSTGLRVLLVAQERAATNGNRLLLRRGPDAVDRVFQLTRTDTRFTFRRLIVLRFDAPATTAQTRYRRPAGPAGQH